MAGQLNPQLLLAVPLAPLAGSMIAGLFGTRFFGNLIGRQIGDMGGFKRDLFAYAVMGVGVVGGIIPWIQHSCTLWGQGLADGGGCGFHSLLVWREIRRLWDPADVSS